MTTAVVTQSNYIPWRGYFDLFRQADVVVIMDSVQYTRRDWRNRNIIKTASGPTWLTIPVEVKGRYFQPIDETRVVDPGWAGKHCRMIENAYRQAAFFKTEAPALFDLLERACAHELLSDINEHILRALCARLEITTPMRRCTDLLDRDTLREMEPTDRLIKLASAVGASRYLSGPAARTYLDEAKFSDAGIEVGWMSYEGYREYQQVGDPTFEPRVSIVDLLLNTGAEATSLINARPASPAGGTH